MFKLIIAALLFVVVGCSKETSIIGLSKNKTVDSVTVTIDLKNYNGVLPLVDTIPGNLNPSYDEGWKAADTDKIHRTNISFKVALDNWIDVQYYTFGNISTITIPIKGVVTTVYDTECIFQDAQLFNIVSDTVLTF